MNADFILWVGEIGECYREDYSMILNKLPFANEEYRGDRVSDEVGCIEGTFEDYFTPTPRLRCTDMILIVISFANREPTASLPFFVSV